MILFSPFRLDPDNEQLWDGARAIQLKPKTFALLRYLVERPQRLITKDELLNHLWGDAHVSDAVLKTHVAEIRRALGDDIKSPRFIETAHRRGYRFIKTTSVQSQGPVEPKRPMLAGGSAIPTFVGREKALASLQDAVRAALGGRRQVVFVTGEPGIGKTTLVDTLVESIRREDSWQIARGQCIEQYGEGEAYLPILEALGRLCRRSEHAEFEAILRSQAPSWLPHLPSVWNSSPADGSVQPASGATSQRMLRELAEALEAMTAQRPLILVLEDLHWADYSTLDVLSYVARRTDAARLMILGTYRPVELLRKEHPLQSIQLELVLRKLCRQISLGHLDEGATERYLAARFSERDFPVGLASLVHRRTEGSPLFMVQLIDSWLESRALQQSNGVWIFTGNPSAMARDVPKNLFDMIGREIDLATPFERSVLEAASVVGVEFSAAAVAAALEEEVSRIEELCGDWARRERFLRPNGKTDWPDRVVASSYRFAHAVFQQVAYERMGATRHAQLHLRVGERLERAFGPGSVAISTELALHFELGGDNARAARYLHCAAEQALHRSAFREATDLLRRGLALLQHLPKNRARLELELGVDTALANALAMLQGPATAEVRDLYVRAQALCVDLEVPSLLVPTMVGLFSSYFYAAAHADARRIAEELLKMGTDRSEGELQLMASYMLGNVAGFAGGLIEAREHFERAKRMYRVDQHHSPAHYQMDLGTGLGAWLAPCLWLLGYPDAALRAARDTLAQAEALAHPYSMVMAHHFLAQVLGLLGESHESERHAEASSAICTDQGFPVFLAAATVLRGVAQLDRGHEDFGMTLLKGGIASHAPSGTQLGDSFPRSLLAQSCMKLNDLSTANQMLADAFESAGISGERWWEPELLRLEGELALKLARASLSSEDGTASSPLSERSAEQCFHAALALARTQAAKSLELRAATSLARLWKEAGKRAEAHALLADIYHWFTEGLDTADLKQARRLLEELAARDGM